MTVDRLGRLLVADTHFYRVLVYSPDGRDPLPDRRRRAGHDAGAIRISHRRRHRPRGQFLVAEYGENDRIQVFSPEGKWLRQWGGHGYEPGEFLKPRALAIDEKDRLFVADSCNHRIQVFDTQGKLLNSWGSRGDAPGQMSYPYDLAIGPDHCLYVCEYGNHRVQKFDLDGKSLGIWGTRGRGPGQLFNPYALAVDSQGTSRSSIPTTIEFSGSGCERARTDRQSGSSEPPGRVRSAGDARSATETTTMMLGNWSISFGNPWWLILLPLVLPPLVWSSYRSLAGLGPVRRALAILLRAAVITLIVLALAELQTVWRSDRLATIFLLDVSNSVPPISRSSAFDYVTDGVKEAAEERPGRPGGLRQGAQGRSSAGGRRAQPDRHRKHGSTSENTDIGAAVKLALASFPEDTARRIVVLSDGNENRGNLFEQGLTAKALGIQVDVLPIEYFYDREVLVEKVSIPPDVKKGETVNIDVVIRASEPTTGHAPDLPEGRQLPGPGRRQRAARADRARSAESTYFTLKQLITEPNFYTFSAEFIPEQGSGDQRAINNIGRGVHPRARQGPGALDRRDRAASMPSSSRPCAKGNRGQGAGRAQDRRLRRCRRRPAAHRPGPAPAVMTRSSWPTFPRKRSPRASTSSWPPTATTWARAW